MTLLEDYLAAVNARIEREGKLIVEGAAPTLEDYKRRCGIIAGLRTSLGILQELLETKPREER